VQLIAMTRGVPQSFKACQLTHIEREPIDVDLAREQHAAYTALLVEHGCEIVDLPADDALPDCVFIEDTAVVFDEIAIATVPGAPSRRDEVDPVAGALANHRNVVFLSGDATLDGGDVLTIGKDVYVGVGQRSEATAVFELHSQLENWDYTVHPVPFSGCLHLKTAVTRLRDDLVLANTSWVDPAVFGGRRVVDVDPSEPMAANVLNLGNEILMPKRFPKTAERVRHAGLTVRTIDLSELQKAEGGMTCCSLIFRKV
jgi:dimethylargininase